MKLLSWNVNGLRAVHNKNLFMPLLESEKPDVLLLQETKAGYDDLPGDLEDVPGYHVRLHSAKKKGYSGVGIYTTAEPDEWFEGIGNPAFDDEGRVMGARFGEVVALSVYFPNSQAEGKRIDFRLKFGAELRAFLGGLCEQGLHVVLGGDYNVAHEPIDLARPKPNEKNPGYLPAERQWMSEFLASGFIDTWRHQNPERPDVYSWWSYRTAARGKNIGWRLDYVCVDEGLYPRVGPARILTDVMGSDHCPVGLTID